MSTPRMPFAKWVDTHVHYQRAPRLQAIMEYLEAYGPQISHDIQKHLTTWGVRYRAPAVARLRVTIDTVQRDLALLIERGYLQRVDQGDRYEWGGGRHIRIWRYALASATL